MMRRRNAVKKSTSSKKNDVGQTNNSSQTSVGSSQTNVGSSILGNMVMGATIGAGSSLGHRAVDAVMGSTANDNQTNNNQSNNLPCEKLLELYHSCLSNQQNNCDFLKEFVIHKCNQ